MSSTSATRVSPAAPPTATAANFCLPDNKFSFFAFAIPLLTLGDFKLRYLPARLALIALLANPVAIFAPAVPRDTT